jgi:protein gp37
MQSPSDYATVGIRGVPRKTMQHSKIEWTDNTFNPWWGCVNVSPACDHCYAETFAARHTRTKVELWGKDAHRSISSDAYWDAPRTWSHRAQKTGIRERVFCGSMCDVMERRADLNEPRHRLFNLIEDTPYLDWLLLTKRPQEYRHFFPKSWLKDPRHNVWVMTTCESQEFVWRIEEILKVPAIVYGISLEPLLSPVKLPKEFVKLRTHAWVITGGESGRKPRPSEPDWFRSLRDQSVAAGVPFHFKQWGEFGSDLVKIGKIKAGRMLDGLTWDEFPQSCQDYARLLPRPCPFLLCHFARRLLFVPSSLSFFPDPALR